ncbi:MAG: hypothetical protein MUF49_24755 [Oculatellaceae cyanobacterium Prado106]|jgi:hypothetical protein|nr:hypothetical protein [Oculatellaceae cyanobacterium Prado106]
MELTTTEAGEIALDFLMTDLNLPEEDWEFFSVLSSRAIGETWCVVEVGLEGFPDKWVLQVFDTKECDPCYTFNSPIGAAPQHNDLEDMPESIAQVVTAERNGGLKEMAV